MRLLGVTLLLIFLVFSGSYADDKKLVLLGVEFPSIEYENWLLDGDKVLMPPFPIKYDLLFYLSSKGKVDSFVYSPENRPYLIDSISNSFKGMQFYPARYNGEAIPFILPAEITFKKKYTYKEKLIPVFPYREPDCVRNRKLIERCLELNGFELPGVKKFPSYYFAIGSVEEDFDYPYLVYKLRLDSAGTLLNFDKIMSVGSDYSNTFNNLLLYADFKPALYYGKGVDSEFYLVFRIFNTVQYPTLEWHQQDINSGYPFEIVRIEPMLYLDSVINPPLPINAPDKKFRYDKVIPFRDTLEMEISINKSGEVRWAKSNSKAYDYIKNDFLKIVRKLKFLPARDINNSRVDFRDRMTLVFLNSKEIEIDADWLP
jgi:hypothetical protein